MRKLMVLATVAIIAACSQAASFRWSASGVTDVNGTSPYSGTAMLYAIIEGVDTLVDTKSMTSGAITASVFSSADLVAGTTYSFYYTMEDADGNTFRSDTKSSRAQATATPSIGFLASGAWTPVPEPTSGLLMLLGVAGLALRRRRA